MGRRAVKAAGRGAMAVGSEEGRVRVFGVFFCFLLLYPSQPAVFLSSLRARIDITSLFTV